MRRVHKRTASVAFAGILAVALASCGNDKPAVCGRADDRRTSLQNLQNVTVSEDGLDSLSSALGQVKTDFQELKDDAKNQFQPQIDAVRASLDQLSASVSRAKAAPSAASLATVGTAVQGLASSAKSLTDAVSGTC